MDPNATLAELRQLVDDVALCDKYDPPSYETTNRMADLFDALDNWLRAGGCLPEDWER
jgi:hypothetical protein